MGSYPDFLGCFSVPALRHLQLTSWFTSIDDCFLINDSPRFPNIEHLTLVESTYTYHQYQHLVRAFPRVTHLTLRNPYQLTNLSWQNQSSPSWSNLRRVTFHLTFSAISHYEPYYCHFGWLGRHEDQPRQALQICVLDSSRERGGDADKRLFGYYKALDKYGPLEGSRLDQFLQAKAYFSEFTEFGGHRFDQLWDSKSNPYYL
ncbi:hypothetical protein BJ138DRAFT_257695 [Hygrophoropsis aurantiaca]|uniref:Uncharacterized protein n=1 Tax=Hygrophoropsis aurantiaca TaxID=72124 RepID=A0ACB8A7X1_9AGAM|nr:hypothetical protein BJ138DRAFT_257695 [Hygrophoropsis aurantiaca]